MALTQPDGAVLYKYPDELSALVFNGTAVEIADLVEAKAWPDGWGYVLLKKALFDADDGRAKAGMGKTTIDGQTRTYTYWGKVAVTLP